MAEKFLSVLMASYNGEKYLRKTLNSVFGAVSPENEPLVEFIFINDGSTDKTQEIFEDFAKEHSFTLINQENQGVVKTLNTTLRLATGEFIYHMDHDDFLSDSAIDKIINGLHTYPDTDMLIFDYFRFTEDGKEWRCKGGLNFKPDDGQSAFVQLYKTRLYNPPFWNRVVRRSCLAENGLLQVDENIRREDMATSPKIFAAVKKVTYLPEALYHYRVEAESSLNRLAKNADNYMEIQMAVINSLLSFAETRDSLRSDFKEALYGKIGDAYWDVLDGIKRNGNFDDEQITEWKKHFALAKYGKWNRKYLYRWLIKLIGVKKFYKLRYKN